MLIAAVLVVRAVLESTPFVTMLPTAAQLGVEGVQGFDVEPGQRLRPEQGPDVLADVSVAPPGRWIDVEYLEPRVEQLTDVWHGSADCADRRPDSVVAFGSAPPPGQPSAQLARPQ